VAANCDLATIVSNPDEDIATLFMIPLGWPADPYAKRIELADLNEHQISLT